MTEKREDVYRQTAQKGRAKIINVHKNISVNKKHKKLGRNVIVTILQYCILLLWKEPRNDGKLFGGCGAEQPAEEDGFEAAILKCAYGSEL